MGYWKMTGTHSDLLGQAESCDEVIGVWGDRPADTFDNAIDKIVEAFQTDLDRMPTKSEILNGLMFSLQVRNDIPDGTAV